MFTLHNIVKSADLRSYSVTSHPCPECKETFTTSVTPEQLWAYNQGAYAQNVLPHLSADERERFISGYCATCWGNTFDWDEECSYCEDSEMECSYCGVEVTNDPEPIVIRDEEPDYDRDDDRNAELISILRDLGVNI